MCVPEERIVPEVLLVDINPIPGQYNGDIDKRVENKVAILNARCPLSGEVVVGKESSWKYNNTWKSVWEWE